MFAVNLNRANYEYDVHSIVKAFWPEEQVSVLTPETKEEKRAELETQVRLDIMLQDEGAVITVGEETYEWIFGGETAQVTPGDTYKDGFKRFLYRTLCAVTGKTLPWGNLTGIRPTKIAYGLLDEGKSDQEIVNFLQEKHYVSDEKALLSIDIAKRERELLKDVHYEGGYSLYIGIPFCPTTCLYCSFTSYPIFSYRKVVDDYVDCVIKEMEYTAKRYAHKILDSVYVGGGTPTTLEPAQLDKLLGRLKELFDFSTV